MRSLSHALTITALLVLSPVLAAAQAPGPPPAGASPAEVEADRLLKAEDWRGAAAAYGALAALPTAKPRFALRQGLALAALGQDAPALAALERAVAGGVSPLALGLQL